MRFLAHCLQGRFFAIIHRVGRNCRVNINLLLFLIYVVLSTTTATTAGELPS